MPIIEKMYTLTEVIARLNLDRRTFYRYIESQKMKAVKIGRKWAVKESDLLEFLAKGTNKPSEAATAGTQEQTTAEKTMP
jgi:excisionase family DNA binding protein